MRLRESYLIWNKIPATTHGGLGDELLQRDQIWWENGIWDRFQRNQCLTSWFCGNIARLL